jgi:hypothetical protein
LRAREERAGEDTADDRRGRTGEETGVESSRGGGGTIGTTSIGMFFSGARTIGTSDTGFGAMTGALLGFAIGTTSISWVICVGAATISGIDCMLAVLTLWAKLESVTTGLTGDLTSEPATGDITADRDFSSSESGKPNSSSTVPCLFGGVFFLGVSSTDLMGETVGGRTVGILGGSSLGRAGRGTAGGKAGGGIGGKDNEGGGILGGPIAGKLGGGAGGNAGGGGSSPRLVERLRLLTGGAVIGSCLRTAAACCAMAWLSGMVWLCGVKL